MDNQVFLPLIIAVVGLTLGYSLEGNKSQANALSPREKFFKVIKWISIIVIFIYLLILAAALTDGIGDIPLLGGGYIWVRGHWRRR